MPAKLKDAVDSLERVMQEAKIAEKMNAILEKDEAEIGAMAEKIQTFTVDKGRIEKGREFRQIIQSMNYSISEDTEKELMVLLPFLRKCLQMSLFGSTFYISINFIP